VGPVCAAGGQGVPFGYAQGRFSTAVVLRLAKHSLRLSGQPASLNSQGVRSEQLWVQVPKRWMVGPEVPLQDSMSDDLGLGVKSVLRERNGAASGVDAGVSPQTP
jgi:hypothetical protein